MKIQKAVITAAGPTQRDLPLQTLVDRDGAEKSALAIVLEEVLSAGIEDVCVVVHPGDEIRYAEALRTSAMRITYTVQTAARGYGHALYCARDFVGDDPFLHLVSDHLYTGSGDRTCTQAVIEVAEREGAAVSAVQQTRESKLPYYGAVRGARVGNTSGLYAIEGVLEKPTPTQAEQELLIPGLRAGHYLCLFGIHALTPAVMALLAADVDAAGDGPVGLSPALAKLARKERYLAFAVPGRRFNVGVKYGLLNAQLALALSGVDREEVLTQLVELLATREQSGNGDAADAR